MSPRVSDPSAPVSAPSHDPYRGVVLVLLITALLGAVGAVVVYGTVANPLLLDAAVTLVIATGILLGVAVAQALRAKPLRIEATANATPPKPAHANALQAFPLPEADGSETATDFELIRTLAIGTAAVGGAAIFLVLLEAAAADAPTLLVAAVAAGPSLVAAGLSGMAARYLGTVDLGRFPEAPELRRGARVVAWMLTLTALSFGLEWARLFNILRVLHFAVLAIDAAVCYSLFKARRPRADDSPSFPLDIAVFSLLGSRPNFVASVLDSAEAQLGIDLRSTWALTLFRRSLEPLLIGLCLLAWLSTSLTVVGVEEQGLIERLGVPVGGDPLPAGLHMHWPWPVDRVFRIPVKRVETLEVGHEGEEGSGPENVLWAVEHAPNEYTLVLGNGRDLITVDAAVQFRIADARAWRYHSQNPAEALKAIAYRAVMRNTVNRTLSDVLSENLASVTANMRAMVQADADALGLGVEVMAFTVGGMHPPVPVAADYEGVVSAELGKVTAVVNAQVFRNQTLPAAETAVLSGLNTARAQAVGSLAEAAGQAWSFRTLEAQFRTAPQEYYFRRRLEAFESVLSGRAFTVLDSRIERDGGELWLMQ